MAGSEGRAGTRLCLLQDVPETCLSRSPDLCQGRHVSLALVQAGARRLGGSALGSCRPALSSSPLPWTAGPTRLHLRFTVGEIRLQAVIFKISCFYHYLRFHIVHK